MVDINAKKSIGQIRSVDNQRRTWRFHHKARIVINQYKSPRFRSSHSLRAAAVVAAPNAFVEVEVRCLFLKTSKQQHVTWLMSSFLFSSSSSGFTALTLSSILGVERRSPSKEPIPSSPVAATFTQDDSSPALWSKGFDIRQNKSQSRDLKLRKPRANLSVDQEQQNTNYTYRKLSIEFLW